jgi:hypothetical protein
MVHFPTLSSTAYVFSGGFSRISQRGFPHSEIPGSKPICGSPGLIAAYRVLHRLLMPRHSPYTLSSLTIRNSNLRLPASGFRRQASDAYAPGARAESPEPARESFMHTARVWSEKTTVCRIFSCQRSSRPEADSLTCGFFQLTPRIPVCKLKPFSELARLVENTGLEPVTSWLQTRRSPS